MPPKHELREGLGLTQQQIADYIEADRALFGNYEKGKRPLPSKASIRLSELYLQYLQFPKNEAELAHLQSERSAAAAKKMEKQLARLEADYKNAAWKLENLKTSEAYQCKQLLFWRHLQANMQENDPNAELKNLLLNLWIHTIQIDRKTPAAIVDLEYKLHLLGKPMEYVRSLLVVG
ncbi:MAG: helix-turn-helix domain-containing protein [Cytophagales bacterium]